MARLHILGPVIFADRRQTTAPPHFRARDARLLLGVTEPEVVV